MGLNFEKTQMKALNNNNSCEINSDKINLFIIDFIGKDTIKKTPADIILTLKKRFNIKKKEIKKILNNLVSKGELEYLNIFGRTYLDISFSKPVRISQNIVLKPPQITYSEKRDDVIVSLEKGTAFGRGTHPTTRLSLQAIDYLLNNKREDLEKKNALDIGTGSGVLAITASLFGIAEVKACDIDLVSVNEAKNNLKLNPCGEISITENFNKNRIYDFIFANLRFPTLIDLFNDILFISQKKSVLVLSGIKKEETGKILRLYTNKKFEKIWEKSESGWVGLVLKRIY